MAEARVPGGKSPAPRQNDPRLSRSPESEINADVETPITQRRGSSRSRKGSWLEQNQTVVLGVGAGVVLVVLVLVLGWLLGWFGGGSVSSAPPPQLAGAGVPQPPPAAPMAPADPMQPPMDQPQPGPMQPGPMQPDPSLVPPPPAETPQAPPLPEDVAEWKREDYFRARRENHPKLLEAVARLGEKFPGNTKAAEVLVELLKPLPPPPEPAPSEMPGAVPAQPGLPGAVPAQPGLPGGVPAPSPQPVAPQPAERRAQPLASSFAPGPLDMSVPGQPPAPAPGPAPSPAPAPAQPAPQAAPGPNMPHSAMPGGMMPPMPMPGGMMPGGMPGSAPFQQGDLSRLVETIVEALGVNGCALARNTLEQILAGTFATDDDKTAVEAVLKTLAFHSRPEYDALLLRVLSSPSSLRPESRSGPWTARDMQAKAFELIKVSASAGLRVKLAEALIASGKSKSLDPQDTHFGFLLSTEPANCGAQILLYEKGNVKKELKAAIEQQFIDYGSIALAGYLKVPADVHTSLGGGFGMPMGRPPMMPAGMGLGMGRPRPAPQPSGLPGGGLPGEPEKAAADDPAPRLAAQLWSKEFLAALEPQLAELRSFEKQPQLVVLAATLPLDSVRSVLFKTLRRNWNEGPKALETVGLTDKTITDPGLLVMVKSLPRKDSPSTSHGWDEGPGRGGRGTRQPYVAPAGAGRLSDAAQKKQQAEQDWMDVSAKLVYGWCKRLNAATTPAPSDTSGGNHFEGFGESEKPAAEEAKPATAEVRLPGFELPAGATVVASHHVLLPDVAAPADFSQAQPGVLEVFYVRAEESNKPKKALGYYCRQARASLNDAKSIDKSIWIDKIVQGSQKDRRRSIDVLLTRSETAVGNFAEVAGGGEDETDLIVEVLIIEIKDPSKE